MSGNQKTVVKVRYSEVDRMGLVYHVNYLEYFELARSDWVRNYWRPYKEIEDEGYCLVVLEAALNYHKPALYDDVLVIEAHPSDWGRSRLTFDYAVYRECESKPLCTGKTVHCFLNSQRKVIRLPSELVEKLEEFRIVSNPVV